MVVSIEPESPASAVSRKIIAELEAALSPHYPPSSQHGYSVEKLLSEGVSFFVVWHESQPAGCGGVQLFGSEYGELKRMYIRPEFRGLGLARLLIDHLSDYARSHRVTVLRLETGIHQHEGMGFTPVPPFGEYRLDPLSVFYERHL